MAAGAGFGAFNLVRTTAYRAIGGHTALSLRPDDDMRLGQRLKAFGLRQRVMDGTRLIAVEWYPSFSTAVRGLEKNMFAVFNYSLPAAVGATCSMAAFAIAPYGLLFVVTRVARWLLLGAVVAHASAFVIANRIADHPAWRFLPLLPFLGVLFLGVTVRNIALTLIRGGMYWRGTFYALGMLRSQTGLEKTG